MTIQTPVYVSTAPDDGQGDKLRDAFIKINERFQDIASLMQNRGNWTTGTQYEPRDYILESGEAYVCVIGHTAGTFATDLAAGKWASVDALDLRADLASTINGKGAALVGFQQAGTGAVDRTAQDKMRESVSVQDFGATLDGVTNDATALFNANAAAVAAKVSLLIPGVMHIGTPTTITAPIVDTLNQMFSATSQVTIANGLPVRPDWWGDVQNSLNYATNALPSTGGIVKLANRTYKPNNHVYGFGVPANAVYFSKANVSYVGEKMPQLSNDCKKLEGGTVVQGQIIAYANNIEFRDLGVDSGHTVMNTYFGGAASPGLSGEGLLCTYPDNVAKAAAQIRYGVRLHNIAGLCMSPSALTHAMIVGEGYSGVVCTGEMLGCYGTHGIVIKCKNVRAEQFTSFCNAGEGVIIKSDAQATAQAVDIQIGKIFVDASGPSGWSPHAIATTGHGLQFNPDGNVIDRIQIGSVEAYGYQIGVGVAGSFSLSDVQIGSIKTDGYGVTGGTNIGINLNLGGTLRVDRFQCANVVLRNHAKGVVNSVYGVSQTMLGNVEAVNMSDVAIEVGSQAYLNIACLKAQNVTNGVFRITGTPKLLLGSLWRDQAGSSKPTYTSTNGGLAPALKNGWTQISGNDIFGVDLSGGRVNLKGLVLPGTSNILCTLPQWAWPSEVKRCLAQGRGGSGQIAIPVTIGTDGDVKVNEVSGGTANCTNWLSLTGVGWDAAVVT